MEGREFKLSLSPGRMSLDGFKQEEDCCTLGGLILSELFPKIGRAMQAEAIAYERVNPEPSPAFAWEPLPDDVAEAVSDRVF